MSWSLSEWIQNLAAVTVIFGALGAVYDWARHPQGAVRRFFKWLKSHIIDKLVASPREIARLEKRLDELAARYDQPDEADRQLADAVRTNAAEISEADKRISDAMKLIENLQEAAMKLMDRMDAAQDGLESVGEGMKALRSYTNSLLAYKDGDVTITANIEQVRSWIDQVQHQIDILRDTQQREVTNINETLGNVATAVGTLEGAVQQLQQPRNETAEDELQVGAHIEVMDGGARGQSATVIEVHGEGKITAQLDHPTVLPVQFADVPGAIDRVVLGQSQYRVIADDAESQNRTDQQKLRAPRLDEQSQVPAPDSLS